MTYLFCAYREWALELYRKLSKKYKNIILLQHPKKLKFEYVKKINPELIFFPDWSWIVPEE
ncbi:MAG: methionyl-tRNA formyltransferase, partial [Candidatus Nitrosotenuis sp.]